MAFSDMQTKTEKTHSILMENREKIRITGVDDVDNFDEFNMQILTCMGVLCLRGEGMHILRFDVEAGELCIEGQFDEIIYTDEQYKSKGSFLKRLLG